MSAGHDDFEDVPGDTEPAIEREIPAKSWRRFRRQARPILNRVSWIRWELTHPRLGRLLWPFVRFGLFPAPGTRDTPRLKAWQRVLKDIGCVVIAGILGYATIYVLLVNLDAPLWFALLASHPVAIGGLVSTLMRSIRASIATTILGAIISLLLLLGFVIASAI